MGVRDDIPIPDDDKFFVGGTKMEFSRSLPAEIPSLNKEYKNLITTWYP